MNKNGFTLIELLVVVLIIGILAAAALPQYQRAVDKSRAAELFVALKAVVTAQKIHEMETGEMTADFSSLSIDMPNSTPMTAGIRSGDLRVAASVNSHGRIYAINAQNINNLGFNIYYYLKDQFCPDTDCFVCMAAAGNDRASRTCRALGGQFSTSNANGDFYLLNL